MIDRRIVFALVMPRDEISGGTRNSYRHAELLDQAGFEAVVYSPDGHPTWFHSHAKVLPGSKLTTSRRDIIVMPETINASTAGFLGLPAEKQMFCQSQFYAFNDYLGLRDHSELSIAKVYCSSESIAAFYRSIYGYENLDIVPCAVDGSLFRPAEKKLQIAYVPRRRPFEAQFIRTAFQKKYPEYRSLPWIAIENCSEERTAQIMAESALFLALSGYDSLGLTPIEAVSSGCLAIGFHGVGGREYAREDNGIWFVSEQILECVEALGAAVRGLERNDEDLRHKVANGRATAARYNVERTRQALLAHFSPSP